LLKLKYIKCFILPGAETRQCPLNGWPLGLDRPMEKQSRLTYRTSDARGLSRRALVLKSANTEDKYFTNPANLVFFI